MSSICNGFGPIVRDLRRSLGMTQPAFAEALGLSGRAGTVSDWERGVSTPEVEMREQMARLAGKTYAEVFGAKGPATNGQLRTPTVVGVGEFLDRESRAAERRARAAEIEAEAAKERAVAARIAEENARHLIRVSSDLRDGGVGAIVGELERLGWTPPSTPAKGTQTGTSTSAD
jgi:transcriptional regulator with XRE-family HTH domain